MRYFTSDTHFGHKNIIKYSARPFADVDEMNWKMIQRWNEVVGPDDVVFHLGDVALGQLDESLPLVSHLNGHKYLVIGNHDRIFSGRPEKHIDRFWPKYNKVFQGIVGEQLPLELADGTDVLLSHFPYVGDSRHEDRYADKRPVDDGRPLVHGHVHEKWVANGRQYNVGVDVHNFYPVSEDTIIEWVQGLI